MNKDQENKKKVNPIIKDENVINIESKLNNADINNSKEVQDLYRVLEEDKQYILRLINERDFYKDRCEKLCNYLNNRYYTDNMNSNICNMINNQIIQNNQQTQYWMNMLRDQQSKYKDDNNKVKEESEKAKDKAIKKFYKQTIKNNKNVMSILKYAKIDKELLKIVERLLGLSKDDDNLIEGDE